MKRRHILARVGSGTIAGIAGCIGAAESPADSVGENGPDRGTTSPSNASDDGKCDTDPNNAPIDERSCPPSETDRENAVCSHTVDAGTAAVYIEPVPERSALDEGAPVEEITLTLHNQSSSDLTFNPYSWRIWHKANSEWEEVQQNLSGNGHLTVSADDGHSWSFMEAIESIQDDPELKSGLYAAEIGVPDPEDTDDWIACIALVRLSSTK